MTVNFTKGQFNLREKLKELERPSVDKLVTKDADGKAYIDTISGNTKLENIDTIISDTAVDVFVYDTRKDSDGGAWRKRTQHTSWYNETLNTSTRGSRREFPAVAVIVSETGSITIYDGDDPDLPMWMVFNGTVNPVNASGTMLMGNNQQSSVKMLNGVLVYGTSGQGAGRIKFICDDGYLYWSTTVGGKFKGNISQRNSGQGYDTSYASALASNNTTIGDVAITVLPNAPIDETTGLPVPTIAFATEGGISVIKDDGTVVDMEATSTTNYRSPSIAITKDEKILLNTSNRPADNYSIFHVIPLSIFTSDRSYTYEYEFLNEGFYEYSTGSGSLSLYNTSGTFFEDVIETKLGYIAVGSNFGLKNIQHIPQDLVSGGRSSLGDARFNGGMQCGITTNYNTGWMHSNIKGAFLSDTDATNVTGTELIPNPGNGNFTATTNWQAKPNGGTVSVSGGNLVVSTSGNYRGCEVTPANLPTLVSGKRYVMSIDVASVTAGSFRFGVVSGAVYDGVAGDGVYSVDFTSNGNVEEIFIDSGTYGSAATIQLNSVNLREAERDRSANSKALGIHGTITKSVVATGAELVAYSGFSASNYLRAPSRVNYGNPATISILGWFKINTTQSADGYSYLGSVCNTIDSRSIGLAVHNDDGGSNSGKPYLYDNVNGALQEDSTRVDDDMWHHLVGILDGTSRKLYLDGVLIQSDSGSTVNLSRIDVTAAGHWLNTNDTVNHSFKGSLSLVRFSKSVPSPEQIKKIYEDEKMLFQENAACTLYGSSDAVTALAYDDSNNLLHVGTSSGRSDFQGLRRINNTTTAVTTAMSASNGLVAEQ